MTIKKFLNQLNPRCAPGEKFVYWSAVTQILGEALTVALDTISLTQYLERKIWQPAGMRGQMNWRMDKEDGTEKAFCCMELYPERTFCDLGICI